MGVFGLKNGPGCCCGPMNPFDDPTLIFPGEAPADPPAAPKELIGAVVKLRGLIKAPELNGQTATVRRVLKNGRVEVLLNGPAKQRLSVKISCLDAAASAAAGEAEQRLVLCPCCGQQMEASSEEECAAHMEVCPAFQNLYPEGKPAFSTAEQADAILAELGVDI